VSHTYGTVMKGPYLMKINWKSAEVVMTGILIIQILVMLIDLDTKRRIVEQSMKLRESIEDAGKRISGASNKRNRTDSHHYGRIPDGMVANGNVPVGEAGSIPADSVQTKSATTED
jgi:hypothetical protein